MPEGHSITISSAYPSVDKVKRYWHVFSPCFAQTVAFVCGDGGLQKLQDTIYINQLYLLHCGLFLMTFALEGRDPSLELKAKAENATSPSDTVPSALFSLLRVTESFTVSLRLTAN